MPVSEILARVTSTKKITAEDAIAARRAVYGNDGRIDPHEIEAAQWFDRDKVRKAVLEPGADKGFFVPPPMAIAHQLIRAWSESE